MTLGEFALRCHGMLHTRMSFDGPRDFLVDQIEVGVIVVGRLETDIHANHQRKPNRDCVYVQHVLVSFVDAAAYHGQQNMSTELCDDR